MRGVSVIVVLVFWFEVIASYELNKREIQGTIRSDEKVQNPRGFEPAPELIGDNAVSHELGPIIQSLDQEHIVAGFAQLSTQSRNDIKGSLAKLSRLLGKNPVNAIVARIVSMLDQSGPQNDDSSADSGTDEAHGIKSTDAGRAIRDIYDVTAGHAVAGDTASAVGQNRESASTGEQVSIDQRVASQSSTQNGEQPLMNFSHGSVDYGAQSDGEYNIWEEVSTSTTV